MNLDDGKCGCGLHTGVSARADDKGHLYGTHQSRQDQRGDPERRSGLVHASEEELMRGQRRSKTGKFQGRPPKVVPMAVHNELVRRKMSQAHDLMRDNVVKATEVLVEIAQDKEVDPAVRLRAVAMIHDRVLGKAPDKVQMEAAITMQPWELAIEGAIVSISQAEVIDVDGEDVA